MFITRRSFSSIIFFVSLFLANLFFLEAFLLPQVHNPSTEKKVWGNRHLIGLKAIPNDNENDNKDILNKAVKVDRVSSVANENSSTSIPMVKAWQNLAAKSFSLAFGLYATLGSIPSFSLSNSKLEDSLSMHVQVANAARPSNAPTSAGSRVNKDAESLLRYGLPINEKNPVRKLQLDVEQIKSDLAIKRFNEVKNDIVRAKTTLSQKGKEMMKDVRSDSMEATTKSMKTLEEVLDQINVVMNDDFGRGSEQERDKLDRAYELQTNAAKQLSIIESSMIPKNYKVEVPEEYANLPQLQGPARIAMTLVKPDKTQFNIQGDLYDKVELILAIDGFNAPVTGGNFVDLIDRGFYNGLPITRSDGFVVQFGDPNPNDSSAPHGFIDATTKEERKIPLEIFLKGEKEPIYSATSEEEGKGAYASKLPFQAYGAIGMARSEFEADSASSQVFFLLFESDLTPAGKNVMDGRYASFGYTIENAELLAGVKEGDIIQNAKVISGLENLQKPK